jgi:hypothetical protein
MPRSAPHEEHEPAGKPEAADTPARPTGPRAPGLTAALIVLALLTVAGSWFLYDAMTRPLVVQPDRAELLAIDAQLRRIRSEVQPIATALASETATTATGVIDVGAYRQRIASLRKIVDATSDLAATSAEALEIRDLVLTGGSQVVAGMNQALDALASNEASVSMSAAVRVEDGIANLDSARTKLDLLLGTLQRS